MVLHEGAFWIGTLASLLSVVAFVTVAVKSRRENAQKARQALVDEYNRGKTDGKESRDNEVRLLTSQRDDARDDLNEARRERDSLRQYRPRPGGR